MKILVAGLTPADQKTLVFDDLRLDRVNRAAEVHWSLSGKPVNVAVGVAHLGAEHLLLTQLGGERFDRFEAELAKLGVRSRLIWSQTPTRCCTTLIDRAAGTVTELVENSPRIGDSEMVDFLCLFSTALESAGIVVLSGTLPQRCPADIYARALALERPASKIIADLQGETLLRLLEHKPFLVKPNREELAATLDRNLDSENGLWNAMRELNRRGAQWVLVTDGPRTVRLSSETEAYRFEPVAVPKDKIVNPIGCGDSMTAAIAWSLHRGGDVFEAVKLGMAASTANLKQMFPARLDRLEIVETAKEISFAPVHDI